MVTASCFFSLSLNVFLLYSCFNIIVERLFPVNYPDTWFNER